MGRTRLCLVLWTLCILEFSAGRTITHHETITKANGDKITRTWTTNDSKEVDDPYTSSGSFTRFYTEPSNPDEMLKEAARAKGMDPSAFDELLRTKAPVVRVRLDNEGRKHTTTYMLDPSGTRISSKTLIEIPPTINYDHGMRHVPIEELLYKKNPGTRTFSMPSKPVAKPMTPAEEDPWPEFDDIFGKDDDDGTKETKPTKATEATNPKESTKPTKPTVSTKPTTPTKVEPIFADYDYTPEADVTKPSKVAPAWEWTPKTTHSLDPHRTPFESLPSPSTPWQTAPKTYFNTKPTTFGSPFDSDPWMEMGDPFSEPRPIVRPTVATTTSTTKRTSSIPTRFIPTPSHFKPTNTAHTRTATIWPTTSEAHPTVQLPETWQWKPNLKPSTETFDWNDLDTDPFDFDDKKPEEPEIPPPQPIDEEEDEKEPKTPSTPKWTSKTIRRPTMHKILPDLLTTSTSTTTTTTTTTTTKKPKHVLTFEPPPAAVDPDVKPFKAINIDDLPTIETHSQPHEKPIKAINIDDLPATEFEMGKIPIDFLDTIPNLLPPSAGEDPPKTKFVKIENIPMSLDDIPLGDAKPTPKDPTTDSAMLPHFNPEVQEILKRGGITEDDIKASNGGPIVKTRVDPDGKTIRTTYRVRKVPTVMHQRPNLNQGHHDMETNFHHWAPATPPKSRIEEFLSKLGMNVNDILSADGQKFTKTIVDDDGRILTATFLLSSVMNDAVGSAVKSGSSEQNRMRKPIK